MLATVMQADSKRPAGPEALRIQPRVRRKLGARSLTELRIKTSKTTQSRILQAAIITPSFEYVSYKAASD